MAMDDLLAEAKPLAKPLTQAEETDPVVREITDLISKNEIHLRNYQLMRDRHGMSKHDRAGNSIEAAACAIRRKALLECLEIARRYVK